MELELNGQIVALAPIIIAITQALKMSALPYSQLLPLATVVLGVLGGLLVGGMNTISVISGLVAGLSAMGIWSGTRATTGK